jgi:hypothetical protein
MAEQHVMNEYERISSNFEGIEPASFRTCIVAVFFWHCSQVQKLSSAQRSEAASICVFLCTQKPSFMPYEKNV